MPTTEGTQPRFAVGSRVRVRKGVTAPNDPQMPLGGWLGTVSQVSGAIYLVRWSGETLEAVGPACRQRWQRDGVDLYAIWLHEKALEADPGDQLCIEQSHQTEAA